MRHWFVNIITVVVIAIVAAAPSQVRADSIPMDDDEMEAVLSGTLEDDTLVAGEMAELNESKAAMEQVRQEGMYKALKRKFIEGNAGFMSLVALALILGLAFCVERIIYLTLSEVNAKKLLDDVDDTIGGKGFIKKINFYPGGKFKQMLKDLSVGGAGEALDVTA